MSTTLVKEHGDDQTCSKVLNSYYVAGDEGDFINCGICGGAGLEFDGDDCNFHPLYLTVGDNDFMENLGFDIDNIESDVCHDCLKKIGDGLRKIIKPLANSRSFNESIPEYKEWLFSE